MAGLLGGSACVGILRSVSAFPGGGPYPGDTGGSAAVLAAEGCRSGLLFRGFDLCGAAGAEDIGIFLCRVLLRLSVVLLAGSAVRSPARKI